MYYTTLLAAFILSVFTLAIALYSKRVVFMAITMPLAAFAALGSFTAEHITNSGETVMVPDLGLFVAAFSVFLIALGVTMYLVLTKSIETVKGGLFE